MTREDSKIMQGVAILLMIFYHLFHPNFSNIYADSLIGNMAMGSNPVSFYLLLSGYGLYCTWERGTDANKYKRCLRLYIQYWIILTIFLFLAYLLFSKKYDLSFSNILINGSGLKTSLYPPSWFILPYCIFAVSYPIIFKVTKRMHFSIVLIGAYLIYMFASYMERYTFFQANIWQPIYLFFPFILGSMMARERLMDRVRLITPPIWLLVCALILLVVIRYYLYTGAFAALYAASVTVLVTAIPKPQWIRKCLLALGRESLNMWLIHAWICWYLLRDFIYSLHYPLLIFCVTVLLSYLSSRLLNIIIKPIISLLK